jgi:trehalose/maltose hydrolase-like predicted phosphorylase
MSDLLFQFIWLLVITGVSVEGSTSDNKPFLNNRSDSPRSYKKYQRQVLPWAKDLTRAGGGCGDDNPNNPFCNITLLALACDAYSGCNAFNSNGFLFACPLGRCDCDSSADFCMRGLDIYSLDPSVNFGSANADTWILSGNPIPDDLVEGAKTGRILWGSPEAAECYLPEVGNGYLATTISWGAIYISGLTNGRCGNVEKARIPSPVALSISSAGKNSSSSSISSLSNVTLIGGALDTVNGMYRRRFYMSSDTLGAPISLEERIYAHRVRKNVLVVEFEILSSLTAGDTLTLNVESLFAPTAGGRTPSSGHVPGDGCAGPLTEDFLFSPFNTTLQRATIFDATTTKPGDKGELWNISIAVELSNASFSLIYDDKSKSILTFIAVISSSLDSLASGGDGSIDSVRAITQTEYISAAASVDAGTLFNEHVSAWAVLNSRSIDIEPKASSSNDDASLARALDVAQHVSSSFYYLVSSIREDWNEGVSPGGISSASYSGAVFMDQDIWMAPSLFFLSPELASSLLQFRYDSIDTEMEIAKIWGFQGTMVAWTAGYEGRLFGCCSGTGGYEDCLEQHVSGAVAWTAWQYFAATGNRTWLQTIGFPILAGVADFHLSRVTSLGNGNYSVRFVLPIDEWSVGSGCGSENPGVDDDAWQNAVTRVSLLRAADAASIVNDTSGRSSLWREVGSGVFPLWNESKGHHNQFTSATCPGGWGGSHYEDRNTVCPEDVNLMASYPLGDEMQIPIEIAERDALLFTPLTCRENAGMTTTMHTIMWLYLSEQQVDKVHGSYVIAAQEEFNRSMHAAAYGPFNVRNEVDKHNDVIGAHYDNSKFLTGEGGYLQSIINGFGGLRILNETTLKMLRPHLPDDVGLLRIRNFSWHGHDMNYTISENNSTGVVSAELVLVGGESLAAETYDKSCVDLLVGGPTLIVDANSEEEWPILVREGNC